MKKPEKIQLLSPSEIKNSPLFKQRIILFAIIFIILGALSIIFAGAHAYWSAISALVILISAEVAQVRTRSLLQIIGAFLGFLAGSLAASLDFGTFGCILFLIIGAVLTVLFLPSKKYALGSAGIGLVVVSIGSLSAGGITWEILAQRLLWTTVGALVVLVAVYIDNKITKKRNLAPNSPKTPAPKTPKSS